MNLLELLNYGSFHGDNDLHSIKKLHDRIATGMIGFEYVKLEPTELKYWHGFSGDIKHQKLCAVAANWLEQQGLQWSSDAKDLSHQGGSADVIAIDRSIAVECGNTKASKIIETCSIGIKVLHIPYSKELYGVMFSRLVEFDALDADEQKALKEAVKVLRVPLAGRRTK